MGEYSKRIKVGLRLCLPVLLLWGACRALAEVPALSERDYLADVAPVLSVTRLAQPLRETPGAVTIIDADMIRRSGAREVAELLRLVPGFHVRRRNGGSMVAGYHATLDIYGARMQVYVDGRSVYSSFYLGDTQRGLASIELADIERIEVLRGSNSASQGANAFLGVVNIVTKSAADSHGVSLAATRGDRGIDDNYARIGWGDESGDMRLSMSRRMTTGFPTLYDDSRRSQLTFRGDFRPSAGDELRISAGAATESFGEGFPLSPLCVTLLGPGSCDTNKQRTDGWRNGYIRLDWSRDLGSGSMLRVAGGIDQELYRSNFVAEQFPAAGPITAIRAPFDFGGRGLRHNLEIQRSDKLSPDLRTVFGAEVLREEARSPFLFTSNDGTAASALRVFGSGEWKLAENWVVNAGGLWERHSLAGSQFAPRLGLNYHLDPESTLRAVTTKSFRMPSIYMLRGLGSYVLSFTPPLLPATSVPYVATSGKVQPETVIANEVGYLGELRSLNLKADVRVFSERINRRHWAVGVDFVNLPGPELHGVEYQFDWRPFADTRLVFAEAQLREQPGRDGAFEQNEAPHRTGSLSLYQKLPQDFDLTLIQHYATAYQWGVGQLVAGSRELDVRLARSFRSDGTRGEVALTVQSLGGGYKGFVPDQMFGRRAFVSLRLDF